MNSKFALAFIALFFIFNFSISAESSQLGSAPKSRKPFSISKEDTKSRSIQIDIQNRSAVAEFYKSSYIPYGKIKNSWTGNTKSCKIGSNSKEYDEATLQNLKYYRAMAGVPSDIRFEEKYNKLARAAALMMEAKNSLSHNPSLSWPCYSKEGRDGAGSSNLCLGCVGPDAIDAYVTDSGVIGLGHRIWALHPNQKAFGTGSSKRAHALYVFGEWRKSEESSQIKNVSWPPKGFVPFKFGYRPDYPWSYQAFGSGTNHKEAKVKMLINGRSIALDQESGDSGILVWYPTGLPQPSKENDYNKLKQDVSVEVEISNLLIEGKIQNIKYIVTFINPESEEFTTADTNTNTNTNTNSNSNSNSTQYNKEMSSSLLSSAYEGDNKKVLEALSKGADPNISHKGWTALMYASYFGYEEIVVSLLKYKADVSIELNGWTALGLAESKKHTNIVNLLQAKTTNRSFPIGNKKKPLIQTVPAP
ncbi:MAG: ankyrin repeat domain-containing protein [Leptospiraceae bacterium]|nr:ankyrin repeat domain-containing protein [Leptospiraceae bacterium]